MDDMDENEWVGLRGLYRLRRNLLEVFERDMADWEREEVSRELAACNWEILRQEQKAAIKRDDAAMPWNRQNGKKGAKVP